MYLLPFLAFAVWVIFPLMYVVSGMIVLVRASGQRNKQRLARTPWSANFMRFLLFTVVVLLSLFRRFEGNCCCGRSSNDDGLKSDAANSLLSEMLSLCVVSGRIGVFGRGGGRELCSTYSVGRGKLAEPAIALGSSCILAEETDPFSEKDGLREDECFDKAEALSPSSDAQVARGISFIDRRQN